MKYIEEYIPKLHIHQHSLLTRKVFFRHNFSALVFFSASTGSCLSSSHLHLQVIFVFKSSGSGSSLDLDHHKMASLGLDHYSIWINITGLDLDHHSIWIISLDRIWIITRSGSSLWTGSGSSLDLDLYCWIWIITRSGSLGVIITGSGS